MPYKTSFKAPYSSVDDKVTVVFNEQLKVFNDEEQQRQKNYVEKRPNDTQFKYFVHYPPPVRDDYPAVMRNIQESLALFVRKGMELNV
ncbi:unnamed protein product, partial [Didymodactylos carnosus]